MNMGERQLHPLPFLHNLHSFRLREEPRAPIVISSNPIEKGPSQLTTASLHNFSWFLKTTVI